MAGKILTFSLFRYPSKSRRAEIVYDEVEPLVGELLEGCRRAVVTPVLGPQRPERSSSGELSFCSRVGLAQLPIFPVAGLPAINRTSQTPRLLSRVVPLTVSNSFEL
jgi:hypothetical protein